MKDVNGIRLTRRQILRDLLVIGIGLILAGGIYGFGNYINETLHHVRDHGQTIEVEVTNVHSSSRPKVDITYEIDGVRYTDRVFSETPPPEVGSKTIGRYVVGKPQTVYLIDLKNEKIQRRVTPFRIVPLLLLLPWLVLIFVRFAYLTRRSVYDFTGVGVGLVLLIMLIGLNFYEPINTQLCGRFGAELVGVPTTIVVSALQLFILGPIILVWSRSGVELLPVAQTGGAILILESVFSGESLFTTARRQFVWSSVVLVLMVSAVVTYVTLF